MAIAFLSVTTSKYSAVPVLSFALITKLSREGATLTHCPETEEVIQVPVSVN